MLFHPRMPLTCCGTFGKNVSYFALFIRSTEAIMPEQLTTTVSTKGQIILPKAIRQTLGWRAGTRLVVETRPEGVLLKPESVFAETRSEDVFGCLAYDGPRSW